MQTEGGNTYFASQTKKEQHYEMEFTNEISPQDNVIWGCTTLTTHFVTYSK